VSKLRRIAATVLAAGALLVMSAVPVSAAGGHHDGDCDYCDSDRGHHRNNDDDDNHGRHDKDDDDNNGDHDKHRNKDHNHDDNHDDDDNGGILGEILSIL
jgi:hypothetical protein